MSNAGTGEVEAAVFGGALQESEDPDYWNGFVSALARIRREVAARAEGAEVEKVADYELVVWAYAYAARNHPEATAERLGDLAPILLEIRKHCQVFGRPLTRLSATDGKYVNRCFAAMDLKGAARRLEDVCLRSDSANDLCYPLILRERAVLARLNERWSESAKWLDRSRLALSAARSAILDSGEARAGDSDDAELRLLRTELDIAAAALMLELERGTPERAAAALQEHDEVLRSSKLGTEYDRATWACNGALLRMRSLHAIGDQQGIIEVFAQTQSDAAFEPIRTSSTPPAIWGKLAVRAALARARLAEQSGEREGLVDALESIDRVEPLVAAGSGEWAWVQIRRAAVSIDLGRPDQALQLLDETEGALSSGQGLKELAQALAAQRARAVLQSGVPVEVQRASLNQLRAEWETLLVDWAAEDRMAEGAGVLWFQEQRDLVESLLLMWVALEGRDLGARQALGEMMRLQEHGSLARELAAPAVSIREVQDQLLGQGRGALLYFLGHEYLHVFVIERELLQHHAIPMREEQVRNRIQDLQAAIARVRRKGGQARDSRLQAARKAVSKLMLPPALDPVLERCEHLLVIGVETLGYVPFEYLLDGAGEAVGATRSVSHAPSLAIALALDRRIPMPADVDDLRIVGVACPAPVRGAASDDSRALPSLPFGPQERTLLRRGLPARGTTWVEGPEVTVDAIRGALVPQANALQVLAHGCQAPGAGTGRAVQLDQGEFLDRVAIESMGLPAFVSLDVCGAGAGLLRPGDDGRGRLWGAALISGAVAVSLPVLDVDYGVTLELRGLVREAQLQRGLSLEDAWRDARQRLAADPPAGMHEVEGYLHHVYGAGWATLARGQGTEGAPTPWRIGALIGIALLAAISVGVARRRRLG